jgi:formate hydrogenlyase subunit 3/multisubunit Na+/H+ antiporter MnhD subunit
MDAAHLHLLLNHIPILGTIFGLLLLIYGMWRNSDQIKRASLGAFILTALVTIPVYLSGDGAADIVGSLPGVSIDIIRQHDDSAGITLIAIEILGAVSLVSLWISRRLLELKRWMTLSALLLAVISSGLGAWTGNLGGQVHHPEVRADFPK